MSTAELLELQADVEPDAIQEMRLRTWARQNYARVEKRDHNWHPVILDEMTQRDRERRGE